MPNVAREGSTDGVPQTPPKSKVLLCENSTRIIYSQHLLPKIGPTLSFFCKCEISSGDISRQHLEISDIERNIRHMQNDMIKLNKLIHKERGIQMDLSQSNVLMENDFIGSLKVSCSVCHPYSQHSSFFCTCKFINSPVRIQLRIVERIWLVTVEV